MDRITNANDVPNSLECIIQCPNCQKNIGEYSSVTIKSDNIYHLIERVQKQHIEAENYINFLKKLDLQINEEIVLLESEQLALSDQMDLLFSQNLKLKDEIKLLFFLDLELTDKINLLISQDLAYPNSRLSEFEKNIASLKKDMNSVTR